MPSLIHQHGLAAALAVTSVFALAGFWLRGVSRSGAIAGFVLAAALYASAGAGAFGALVALFVTTLLATRLGRQRKVALGMAEHSEGRTASQVIANVGVASLFAITYGYTGKASLLAGCAAALAEAAADTVSSEVGQAFSHPTRLITTGAQVPAGTDGGVSLTGTASGGVAALGMASAAALVGLVGLSRVWVVAAAAIGGMLVDSLLGALLERRGWLNNDAVNFLGTLSAAVFAWWLAS